MRKTLAPVLALLLLLAFASVAVADGHDRQMFHVELSQLNDSGASGTADLRLEGNQLTVTIEAQGLSPDLPHAQHFHGEVGEVAECPPVDLEGTGEEGIVTTSDGQPFYFGIMTSLTTEGDTSPDSALAVDRMPVADGDGNVSYERTFEVSDEVAENIGDTVVVLHGIDLSDTGEYSDDFGPSDLDPELPQEATVPAACGEVMAAPDRVDTGAGGTAGTDSTALWYFAGAGLLLAAGIRARRRVAAQ